MLEDQISRRHFIEKMAGVVSATLLGCTSQPVPNRPSVKIVPTQKPVPTPKGEPQTYPASAKIENSPRGIQIIDYIAEKVILPEVYRRTPGKENITEELGNFNFIDSLKQFNPEFLREKYGPQTRISLDFWAYLPRSSPNILDVPKYTVIFRPSVFIDLKLDEEDLIPIGRALFKFPSEQDWKPLQRSSVTTSSSPQVIGVRVFDFTDQTGARTISRMYTSGKAVFSYDRPQ